MFQQFCTHAHIYTYTYITCPSYDSKWPKTFKHVFGVYLFLFLFVLTFDYIEQNEKKTPVLERRGRSFKRSNTRSYVRIYIYIYKTHLKNYCGIKYQRPTWVRYRPITIIPWRYSIPRRTFRHERSPPTFSTTRPNTCSVKSIFRQRALRQRLLPNSKNRGRMARTPAPPFSGDASRNTTGRVSSLSAGGRRRFSGVRGGFRATRWVDDDCRRRDLPSCTARVVHATVKCPSSRRGPKERNGRTRAKTKTVTRKGGRTKRSTRYNATADCEWTREFHNARLSFVDKSFCVRLRRKIVINRENELRARWPERWGFYSKDNVETVTCIYYICITPRTVSTLPATSRTAFSFPSPRQPHAVYSVRLFAYCLAVGVNYTDQRDRCRNRLRPVKSYSVFKDGTRHTKSASVETAVDGVHRTTAQSIITLTRRHSERG